ncbi:MAG: hypothetical protein ACLFQO_13790 [Cyclobacteriaceae bacterium]
MKDFIYSDQFDNYLKGRLSDEEKMAFEQKISQDPLLSSEVKWQQDIHQALGEARRAHLKNRLEQVPVNTGGWYNLSGIQLSAIVASVMLSGGAAYYFYNTQQDQPITQQQWDIRLDIPENSRLSEADFMPVLPEPAVADNTEADLPEEASSLSSGSSVAAPAGPTTKVASIEVMPHIVRPDIMSEFPDQTQEVNYSDFEAPDKNMLQKSEVADVNVEIETVVDSKFPFHYQFFDHKLYLHGDFQGIPYKIIALNQGDQKTLFLQYEGDYYSLRQEQKEVVPLEIISDSTLIKAMNKLNP